MEVSFLFLIKFACFFEHFRQRIEFPDQNGVGTHMNISGMAMTKYAPHEENALKLMRFLTEKTAVDYCGDILVFDPGVEDPGADCVDDYHCVVAVRCDGCNQGVLLGVAELGAVRAFAGEGVDEDHAPRRQVEVPQRLLTLRE